MAPHLKCDERESVPWVRIPPLPPILPLPITVIERTLNPSIGVRISEGHPLNTFVITNRERFIMSKVLFILKRREDYDQKLHANVRLSTGLYNSASFMTDMLNDSGIQSDIAVAIDNNCIDKIVTDYKPTHVIIEALWVVPTKFAVLTKLHPTVQWIIRLHSEMPFMAGEGMAMDWIGDYLSFPNVHIGVNAPRMHEEIQAFISTKTGWSRTQINDRIIYLPNYYPQYYLNKNFVKNKNWVDVSCFGAVRPLKNHLSQAIAAIKFADKIDKQLRFHINVGRIEMKGDPVLRNLKGLFQHLAGSKLNHQLIGHSWMQRDKFLKVCASMDIGMQCNFSETFNIVSADLISQGVPIVGSEEIPWASRFFNAKPSFSDDMSNALLRTYKFPNINVYLNQKNLTKYTNNTNKIWQQYFKE